MSRSPSLWCFDLLFVGSPLFLASACAVAVGCLVVGPVAFPALVAATCVFPLASALAGLAASLAVWRIRRDDQISPALTSFWSGAILASAGLLGGVWWVLTGRARARTACRGVVSAASAATSTAPLPSIFSALPPEQRPTERHEGPMPLARRPAARLEPIHHPLRPLGQGPLSPTVHFRRIRRKPV